MRRQGREKTPVWAWALMCAGLMAVGIAAMQPGFGEQEQRRVDRAQQEELVAEVRDRGRSEARAMEKELEEDAEPFTSTAVDEADCRERWDILELEERYGVDLEEEFVEECAAYHPRS